MRLINTMLAGWLSVIPAAALAASPGGDADEAIQYHHCIATARKNPPEGWAEAMAWSSLRDSEAARHCAAVAMVGLGQYADGAGRLEELAKTSTAAPRVRAGMFDQAALAWLLDKSADKAMADVTQALMLVPGAPDLLVDRAQIEAARNDYQAAQVDLDTVLAATPNNGIELIFRASTRRHLNDRAGAKADIDKALQALPRNPDAWLEKGILARLDNDEDGARAAWSKVIELAPDSAAALTAKQNLDLLDGHAQQ